MKPKIVRVGMLDASTVTREGYYEIVIDLLELSRNLAEIRQDADVPPWMELRLRVEHNGCSDSSCHECGGGGLDVMVEYERGLTTVDVVREKAVEVKRLEMAEKRRRCDYERLKKRYEG